MRTVVTNNDTLKELTKRNKINRSNKFTVTIVSNMAMLFAIKTMALSKNKEQFIIHSL